MHLNDSAPLGYMYAQSLKEAIANRSVESDVVSENRSHSANTYAYIAERALIECTAHHAARLATPSQTYPPPPHLPTSTVPSIASIHPPTHRATLPPPMHVSASTHPRTARHRCSFANPSGPTQVHWILPLRCVARPEDVLRVNIKAEVADPPKLWAKIADFLGLSTEGIQTHLFPRDTPGSCHSWNVNSFIR